jgi:acyl-coenzyme A synthetase/AMP-(fatty) acid ligase
VAYSLLRFVPFTGVCQLANWLLAQGLQRGETIAVFMQNKPAYPILWLACLAIDVYVPKLVPKVPRISLKRRP